MNNIQKILDLTKCLLKESSKYIVLCEGIDDGLFGTLDGISKEFPDQSIELPCSENASVAMALGAASYGLFPILCYQRVEFALLALEQLFNNSSKINYLSGGDRSNPALFRFIVGRGWGQGPSHSQSLESLFLQIPEINLFLPVFPEDSEFIFNFFSSRSEPTISLEHRWIHYAESSGVKVMKANPYIIKDGVDITIVASSFNVLLVLKVAQLLESFNISVEVVNMFCLSKNSSKHVIKESIEKTKKIIFVDLAHAWNGVSNHCISEMCQAGFIFESPPIVLGCKQSFSPSSFRLSSDYYLNCSDIGDAVADSIGLSKSVRRDLLEGCGTIDGETPIDQPSLSFNGPF